MAERPEDVLKAFIDDFQFNLPATPDWDTAEDSRAYQALTALTELLAELEHMNHMHEMAKRNWYEVSDERDRLREQLAQAEAHAARLTATYAALSHQGEDDDRP